MFANKRFWQHEQFNDFWAFPKNIVAVPTWFQSRSKNQEIFPAKYGNIFLNTSKTNQILSSFYNEADNRYSVAEDDESTFLRLVWKTPINILKINLNIFYFLFDSNFKRKSWQWLITVSENQNTCDKLKTCVWPKNRN